MGQRYWAFISYSHEDARWARWLHRQLEGYVVPRRLVGQPTPAGAAPKRFRPIFKDLEELGAAPDLSERLRGALAESAFLIVVCSPAASRSRWVDAEIRLFQAVHGKDRVLALIVEGEPFASDHPDRTALECLPLALRQSLVSDGAEPERFEPLAADLRPGKGGRRLALLKLLSGMLGIDLGQLVQRDTQGRLRQLVALTGASIAAATVLGGLAVWAFAERNEAIAQRSQAEGLIEFMIGDLRGKLESAGRLDLLDAVGGRALDYYAAQRSHGLDAASLGRRARVLHLLGEIRDRRGDLDAALGLFQEASKSTAELLARQPNDPQRIFDQAQSDYWVGYIALRRGQYAQALADYRAYGRLADQLVRIDRSNPDWQAEVAYADWDIGVALLDEGKADEAATALDRARTIGLELVRRQPRSRDRKYDLAQTYAWLATADYHRGRLDASSAERMAERALYAEMIEEAPNDTVAAMSLATNRYALAQILVAKGLVTQAIPALLASRSEWDRLMQTAPDEMEYRNRADSTLLLLARTYLLAGDINSAQACTVQARDIAQALVRKDPTVVEWKGPNLGGARVLLIEIAATQGGSQASQLAALQPALAEAARLGALSPTPENSLPVADVAAEAALLAGDHESLAGARDRAMALWTGADARLRRAGVASLPAGDRARVLLRELDQRLSLLRAPTTAGRVDYRW